MTMLTSEIAADVADQCATAAGEIGQTFARAFGGQFVVSVGEPEALAVDELADQFGLPGLAVMFHVGAAAMAILVPEPYGLLPAGYDSADPQAQSKLTTLAQELSMLVLPEAFLAEDGAAFRVAHLGTALGEGGVVQGAALLRLSLKTATRQGEAFVVWPLSTPRKITSMRAAAKNSPLVATGKQAENVAKTGDAASPAAEMAVGSIAAPNLDAATVQADADTFVSAQAPDKPPPARGTAAHKSAARGPGLRDLPPYTRSLLKIRVPLSVTLAAKKQQLGQVLEIGPGSILQFEKSCEEMLDLNVSNLAIAHGEAVKVGDKFGLRVTSVILPSERFMAVAPTSRPTAEAGR